MGAAAWLRGVLPLVLVLAAGAAAMAANNRAVTGSPLRLPYAEYQAQCDNAPLFFFQPLKPPIRSASARLTRFCETVTIPAYHASQKLSHKVSNFMFILNQFKSFLLGTVLLLPLLLLPWMTSNRWLVWALAVVGLMMAVQVLVVYVHSHYLAPIVPLIFLFLAEGLRRLRTLRGRQRMSIRLPARYVIVLFLASASWGFLREGALARESLHSRASAFPNNRRMILRQLAAIPGQHIVLVRYAPEYTLHEEWVYNGADIDGQPVIFAHDLGSLENRALLEYFAGRRAWSIYVEGDQIPELSPCANPP